MEQKKILEKLHDIQKEVGYMQKEGRNSSQNYNFLSERQITEKFKELFEKHGILFYYSSKITGTQPSASGKQTLTNVVVEYKFVDVKSGESVAGEAAGQGTDTGDKGVYKAITGAIKYIFMKTFLIPTGDDPEEDTRDERRAARKKEARTYGTSMGGDDRYPTDRDDVPFPNKGDEDED